MTESQTKKRELKQWRQISQLFDSGIGAKQFAPTFPVLFERYSQQLEWKYRMSVYPRWSQSVYYGARTLKYGRLIKSIVKCNRPIKSRLIFSAWICLLPVFF